MPALPFLGIEGEESRPTSRVSKEVAWRLLSPDTRAPPGFLPGTDYLQMDVHRPG